MADAVRDAVTEKGRGQVVMEAACNTWFGRLVAAKQAGGNYSAVFTARTRSGFDAARARVPRCARR